MFVMVQEALKPAETRSILEGLSPDLREDIQTGDGVPVQILLTEINRSPNGSGSKTDRLHLDGPFADSWGNEPWSNDSTRAR